MARRRTDVKNYAVLQGTNGGSDREWDGYLSFRAKQGSFDGELSFNIVLNVTNK